MMDDRDVVLDIQLSVDEARLLMEALAELPFKVVFELIGNLNRQANEYSRDAFDSLSMQRYMLSTRDMKLAIAALGNLPFNRVYRLVEKLNGQIGRRLNPFEREESRSLS